MLIGYHPENQSLKHLEYIALYIGGHYNEKLDRQLFLFSQSTTAYSYTLNV